MKISDIDANEDGVSDIVDVKIVNVSEARSGYKVLDLQFNILTGSGNKHPDIRDVSIIDSSGKNIVLDKTGAVDFEGGMFIVNHMLSEKVFLLSRVDLESAMKNETVFFNGRTIPKFEMNDDEREWALAFLGNYNLTDYRVGSFRKNLVTAYISADRTNQYKIREAFPELKWPAEVCANIKGGAELVKLSLGV